MFHFLAQSGPRPLPGFRLSHVTPSLFLLRGPAVERPVPVRTGTVCGLSPCCVVRLVSSTRGLALPSHEPACLGAATTQTLVRSDIVLASVFRPQRRDAISRSCLGGSALLRAPRTQSGPNGRGRREYIHILANARNPRAPFFGGSGVFWVAERTRREKWI